MNCYSWCVLLAGQLRNENRLVWFTLEVWSAAQCSAAVPGIFESRELLAKDRFGEIVPYVSGGLKWQDGSMQICRWLDWQNFLTSLRLQLRFFDTASQPLFAKVNYFIVSQVGSQKGPIFRVAQFLRREVAAFRLPLLSGFRPVGNTLIALVVQDLLKDAGHDQEYEGDVTIYNGRGLLEFPKLLKNPTDEVLRTYTKASEWETWWHIPEIQNACAIEFARCLNESL
ncbi:SDP1 [Symbiodinium sp. CCMP2456]|nr:SDP1 [Symbiodinium sp. CCMP2456]